MSSSLVVQWSGICTFNEGGMGCFPDERTKIPHACSTAKIKKKKKKKKKKFKKKKVRQV